MAIALFIVTITYGIVLALRIHQYDSWLAEYTRELEQEGWFVSPEPFISTSEGQRFFVFGIGLCAVWIVAMASSVRGKSKIPLTLILLLSLMSMLASASAHRWIISIDILCGGCTDIISANKHHFG